MNFDDICFAFPLIYDIADLYFSFRRNGNGRDEAVRRILTEYRDVLEDPDDGFCVKTGLALALAKNGEITETIKREALEAIDEYRIDNNGEDVSEAVNRLKEYLINSEPGEEIFVSRKKTYDPGWEIGDTFIHKITHPRSKQGGILGWYIVFRKAGEYVNVKGQRVQLVYTTVCPEESIPHSSDELIRLGLLRMMNQGSRWDYLGQLQFSGEKDEESWGLTKIGCFPDVPVPKDSTEENPRLAYPLYGSTNGKQNEPDFEVIVSELYSSNGVNNHVTETVKEELPEDNLYSFLKSIKESYGDIEEHPEKYYSQKELRRLGIECDSRDYLSKEQKEVLYLFDRSCAITYDNNYFCCTGYRSVYLYSIETGKLAHKITGLPRPFLSRLTNDNKLIVKTQKGEYRIYDIISGSLLRSFSLPKNLIKNTPSFFPTPDGRFIISLETENHFVRLQMIETETGNYSRYDLNEAWEADLFYSETESKFYITAVHFDELEKSFYTSFYYFFYPCDKPDIITMPLRSNNYDKIDYNSNRFALSLRQTGGIIFHKSEDIVILDLETNNADSINVETEDVLNSVRISKSGRYLAVAGSGSIQIIDVARKRSVHKYKVDNGCFVDFYDNDTKLLIGTWEKGFCVDISSITNGP